MFCSAGKDKRGREEADGGALFPSWDRICFLVVLGAVGTAFVLLTLYTWGKWGDALIDVGQEIERSWKIVEGRVLYRDVSYMHGPFSPYFNALLLWLFGVRLGSIVLGGFISACVGSILIYLVCRHFLGRISSLAMVAVFLLESVFQHYYRCGAFNFILPYSAGAVHAILFAFGALIFLFRFLETRKRRSLVAAGLIGGLCCLCKIEIAGALFLTFAACTLILYNRVWSEPKRALVCTSLWSLPFILVVVGGYLPFILVSSFGQVFQKKVFKLNLIDITSNVFLGETLGIHNFLWSIIEILSSTAFWATGAVAIWCIAKIMCAGPGGRGKVNLVSGLAAAAVLLGVSWFAISYITLYRCLPVACVVVIVVSGYRTWRDAEGVHKEDLTACAFGLFALLAMARILFRARTADYGFFMALPALVLFSVFLACLLPRWLRFPESIRRPYVFIILSLIVCQSTRNFVEFSLPKFRLKSIELSGPNGRMMADPGPRYAAMRAAMRYLVEHTGCDETLVVIPEGASVNFLTGRRNPTPFNVFIPPEINSVVEDQMIKELQEKEVDRILIIDRRLPEHGLWAPGSDFARKLMKFVWENYSIEAKFGEVPYSHPVKEGGALLLRRKGLNSRGTLY